MNTLINILESESLKNMGKDRRPLTLEEIEKMTQIWEDRLAHPIKIEEFTPTDDSCRVVISVEHSRFGYKKKTIQYTLKWAFQNRNCLLRNLREQTSDWVFGTLIKMHEYTQDLSLLNEKGMQEVINLLTQYKKNLNKVEQEIELRVQYNIKLQKAFLVQSDEMDYIVYGLNLKGEFDEWLHCGNCGHEGYKNDIHTVCEECEDYGINTL